MWLHFYYLADASLKNVRLLRADIGVVPHRKGFWGVRRSLILGHYALPRWLYGRPHHLGTGVRAHGEAPRILGRNDVLYIVPPRTDASSQFRDVPRNPILGWAVCFRSINELWRCVVLFPLAELN